MLSAMNPSQQGPYSIGLLNELHSHFPNLLYAPEQFTSVQEVLNYIIGVASTSPYHSHRALHQINTLGQVPSSYAYMPPPRSSVIPPYRPRSDNNVYYASSSAPSNVPSSRNRTANRLSQPYSFSFTSIPTSSLSNMNHTLFGDQLVSSLVQEGLGGASSASSSSSSSSITDLYFQLIREMVEPLSVIPTPEQIERETTLHDAEPEWVCSICQDTSPMDDPIRCRKINRCGHTFHLSCIDTWFQTHSSCPMCRYDIRSQEAPQE